MRLILFSFLLVSLFFAACDKGFEDSMIKEDADIQSFILDDDKSDKDKKDFAKCFTLVFPLSVIMPDETIISGEKDEVWEGVKNWYEANPDEKSKPSLQFPVDVLWLEKDVVKTIQNKDELIMAKKFCKEKGVKKDCFELVLPTSWTMPDGSTITINTKDDWATVKDWYEAHPDDKTKPSLEYPVDIFWVDKDITKTINNEDEMIEAKKDCE